MIKYALRCEHDHTWDAWFPSINGYDDQHARGLVDCPFCGTKVVEKAPMAPSIVTSKTKHIVDTDAAANPVNAPEPHLPVATDAISLSVPEPLQAMLMELKARIEKSHDYVGDTFAREVRAMHEGESEERPIYGEATASEVRALIEDEIPVAPLPMLVNPKGVKALN